MVGETSSKRLLAIAGAELDRQDADQHQPDGGDQPAAMSSGRSPGQCRRLSGSGAEWCPATGGRHVGQDAVDGRDPQGSVDRDVGRGARRTGSSPVRTSTWRRSTPASSTPAGDAPRLLAGTSSQLARPAGLALRRPGRELAGDPERRDPVPRGHRREGRAGLAAGARLRGRTSCTPAPSRARSGARPTAARRSRSSGRSGTTRTDAEWGAGFGGQAFHTMLPHPTDPQSVTVAISLRRRLPDQRRRRELGAAQRRHPRGVPARGPAVPRVRPVRAQGHPAPEPPRAALPPEPRRRLPLRRPRRDTGTPSPTGCRPTSASRSSSTRTSRTPSSSSRSTAASGATRRRPRRGSGARATPASTWEELGDGLPDRFYVAVMRDAMCADDHDRTGLYFGARNGAVWGSADEGETWRQIVADLPDVMWCGRRRSEFDATRSGRLGTCDPCRRQVAGVRSGCRRCCRAPREAGSGRVRRR